MSEDANRLVHFFNTNGHHPDYNGSRIVRYEAQHYRGEWVYEGEIKDIEEMMPFSSIMRIIIYTDKPRRVDRGPLMPVDLIEPFVFMLNGSVGRMPGADEVSAYIDSTVGVANKETLCRTLASFEGRPKSAYQRRRRDDLERELYEALTSYDAAVIERIKTCLGEARSRG